MTLLSPKSDEIFIAVIAVGKINETEITPDHIQEFLYLQQLDPSVNHFELVRCLVGSLNRNDRIVQIFAVSFTCKFSQRGWLERSPESAEFWAVR